MLIFSTGSLMECVGSADWGMSSHSCLTLPCGLAHTTVVAQSGGPQGQVSQVQGKSCVSSPWFCHCNHLAVLPSSQAFTVRSSQSPVCSLNHTCPPELSSGSRSAPVPFTSSSLRFLLELLGPATALNLPGGEPAAWTGRGRTPGNFPSFSLPPFCPKAAPSSTGGQPRPLLPGTEGFPRTWASRSTGFLKNRILTENSRISQKKSSELGSDLFWSVY